MDGEVLEESTETTLIIDDLLLEEISQVAQENNAIRVPTRENPLRVTTIGDSVAYDADPGIKALIEATEMAEVENRSFGGVGLTQNGFEVYLEESLANKPEVVTVMVGGWDLAFAENDQEKYSEIVESSFEKILEVASLVIVIGMPPTPDTEGLEENRYLINRIYKNISNLKFILQISNGCSFFKCSTSHKCETSNPTGPGSNPTAHFCSKNSNEEQSRTYR